MTSARRRADGCRVFLGAAFRLAGEAAAFLDAGFFRWVAGFFLGAGFFRWGAGFFRWVAGFFRWGAAGDFRGAALVSSGLVMENSSALVVVDFRARPADFGRRGRV